MLSINPAAAAPAAEPIREGFWHSLWYGMRGNIVPTAAYLMTTEVHTYAFSVAANAILSFFPFIVLLLSLVVNIFHSQAMYDVVLSLLRDYLPTGQDFVIRNLRVMVAQHHRAEVFSIVMLLISSTGVFLPLEVALNRVWGFPRNRSYLLNQLAALGLTFACGLLALLSVALSASQRYALAILFRGSQNIAFRGAAFGVAKFFAVMATITIFFLIYWLLPNGPVRARDVLPAAIFTGLLSEVLKYAYMLALPWLNFQDVYGPFSISVTLMFFAFLSGLLLLAGAHLSAVHRRAA